MRDLNKTLSEKVTKHEEKLKAHKESEAILELERKALEEKLERVESKILSTVKNIEYHTAKVKTYKKVQDLTN